MRYLYELDLRPEERSAEYMQEHFKRMKVRPRVGEYAQVLIEGTLLKLSDIDKTLKPRLENWDMERLTKVDKAILRIGVFEMMYGGVPARVVINEMVEVAKLYSKADSASFVNGVLDGILHSENIPQEDG